MSLQAYSNSSNNFAEDGPFISQLLQELKFELAAR